MFTYENRNEAVKLLIKYDMSYSDVIRELGYPSKMALRNWYKEYIMCGGLHSSYKKEPKYSLEEREHAVTYYIEHGKSVSRTVRNLGYPSRPTLEKWIIEIAPEQKKHCICGGTVIKCSQEKKEKAVISLCTRDSSANKVAAENGTTRGTLYKWKHQLLKEEDIAIMNHNDNKRKKPRNDGAAGVNKPDLNAEKADLTQQLMELEKKVQRLKIERDIYEKAAELIKKDKGINIKLLTNREKATIINALRDTYKLNLLLEILEMAKSSYSYQVISLNNDKYFALRIKVKNIFNESSSRYGYRRIHSVLKVTGITVSEKVVRSIMNSENLEVPRVKRKRYSSYKGEISPPVENIINRDFHADKINSKWLTDITEFHIPAGKVYLSPIIDCFDGLPVSWTIGTSPDSNLVNTMLHDAISTLKVTERPIVHSDRGGHYRWPGWIKIMNDNNLTRSMSKKGCSPDNAACEGFFGRLKNEMFYGYSWSGVTIEEFIGKLDKYIRWYGEERIKLSLGGMSPLAFRRSLGLAA